MDTTILAGRVTSRIGFGCGRLVGGASAKASARLIEQARMLGITHFDVAPSYGLGLAEDVVGDALADDGAVTIATKVGIGRPANAKLKSFVRQALRPLLAASPRLRGGLASKLGSGARNQFSRPIIEETFFESLRRLRRDRVDVLLLHEPSLESITPEVIEVMDAFVREGRVLETGSGTSGDAGNLVPFGTVRQYGWSPGAIGDMDGTTIVHGLLRRYPRPCNPGKAYLDEMRALGFDAESPGGWPGFLLTTGLASLPRSIVLVSSREPGRLRAALAAIDWAAARGERAGFLERASALLRQAGTS